MPDKLKEMKNEDWLEITEEVFDKVFSKSAMKRTGLENIKRKIRFLIQ
jgi:epoxyqueuosine reductase